MTKLITLIIALVFLGACAYPQGAILPQSHGTLTLPRGGCGNNQAVCGIQDYTVSHLTTSSVEVSFTNGLPLPVRVTFQAPYYTVEMGVVEANSTMHFQYIRPSVYRGSRIEVAFIAQVLDDSDLPVAIVVVDERIGRNDQVLASALYHARLPRGLQW